MVIVLSSIWWGDSKPLSPPLVSLSRYLTTGNGLCGWGKTDHETGLLFHGTVHSPGCYWLSLDSHIKFIVFISFASHKPLSQKCLSWALQGGFHASGIWFTAWNIHRMDPSPVRLMERIFTEEHMEITLGRRGARAMTWPWMPGNHICSCFYQILEPKVRSVDLS